MPDKNIIEKIKKLLALASSSNENEATAAAEKASLLLAQYNLSLADLGTDTQLQITEAVIETTPQYVTWKMLLISGIAEANCCEAMRNSYTGNVFLVGTDTNLIVCQHLYEYLQQAIERRARYRKGKGRAYLNAFRVGCATRLKERLLAQKAEMENTGIPGSNETPATPAIVVRSMYEKNQAMIYQYLQQQGFKIKTRNTAISNESGFDSGYKAGDRITLYKQERSGDNIKKLTEG